MSRIHRWAIIGGILLALWLAAWAGLPGHRSSLSNPPPRQLPTLTRSPALPPPLLSAPAQP